MSIERELTKELDRAITVATGLVHSAAQAAVMTLATASPIWSGWYQRNHRVVVRKSSGSPSFRVQPKQPPSDRKGTGALALDPGALIEREFDNIRRWRFGDTMFIGNSVPYAQTIEEGTKTVPQGNIYGQAALAFRSHIEANKDKI